MNIRQGLLIDKVILFDHISSYLWTPVRTGGLLHKDLQ